VEIPIGNSVRAVVTGVPRPRNRYGQRPDGQNGVVGVETDASGAPLNHVLTTLASPLVGWVESTTVVAPEPLLGSLPAPGTVVEFTGDLKLAVAGGKEYSMRTTITDVAGIRTLGSAVEVLGTMSAPSSGRSSS